MTLKQALSNARKILNANNVKDATLECELLLRHTLKINRVQLYLKLNDELSPEQVENFWSLIKRRLSHEPTAYIVGHREFYGLDFHVNVDVLIPRPESELLVEKAINLAQKHIISTIAEIGTGCGAIAISLALNLPYTIIYAVDISVPALKVAWRNIWGHGVADRVLPIEGDMLNSLPMCVDLIIANLPYVKTSKISDVPSAYFEPQLALNGGPNGLEKIYHLCSEVSGKLNPAGHLILEIGQGQKRPVTTFLHNIFPSAEIEVIPDLSGINRVVSLTLATDLLQNSS